MKSFEWADATSVEEAIQLTVKGAAIKAGGLDVVDMMKEHLVAPTRLVNIRRIPGLDQISEDEKSIKIGPLVTLAALSENPIVLKNATALAQAAGHAATPQIRNMATIGGNILQRPRCWYFRNEQFPCRKKGGEICFAQEGENQYHAIFHNSLCAIVHPSAIATPLIALAGKIEITSEKDKREVTVEDFVIPPSVDLHRENSLKDGEIITQIIVPKSAAKSYYIKQGEKESFDWPVAECAVVMEMEGGGGGNCKSASVVLGAAAPTPYRAKYAQDALAGKPVNADSARAAGNASMTGATPMRNNGYKVPMFKAIVARTILACAGTNGAAR